MLDKKVLFGSQTNRFDDNISFSRSFLCLVNIFEQKRELLMLLMIFKQNMRREKDKKRYEKLRYSKGYKPKRMLMFSFWNLIVIFVYLLTQTWEK